MYTPTKREINDVVCMFDSGRFTALYGVNAEIEYRGGFYNVWCNGKYIYNNVYAAAVKFLQLNGGTSYSTARD
jgi:hypothetical protein